MRPSGRTGRGLSHAHPAHPRGPVIGEPGPTRTRHQKATDRRLPQCRSAAGRSPGPPRLIAQVDRPDPVSGRHPAGHSAHVKMTRRKTGVSRLCRFFTITGSKVPSRSRGSSISTGPLAAVSTVLGRVPLRMLADPRPSAAVLLMTQVLGHLLGHLLVQRSLEHVLGELFELPVRPGQRQATVVASFKNSLAASASAEGFGLLGAHIAQCRAPSRHLPG